jgi:hypothetical protein
VTKYTLVYWRHQQERHEHFDSLDDAISSAAGGEGADAISARGILNDRNEVVMNHMALHWAISRKFDQWDREEERKRAERKRAT